MEIKKLTLNYTWKHKQIRIAKFVLNHLKNIDAITILYFKLHYTVKITWPWHLKKKELILPLMGHSSLD